MSAAVTFWERTSAALRMVKVSHSIFAMPFALASALLAADGIPSVHTILWIVVAMVAARTAAMAFNRLVDRDIDARNPRTQDRVLSQGALGPGFVAGVVAASGLLFFVACGLLNRPLLWLSPALLAFLLAYSWTKRFTSLCHLWLGVALGLSAPAAWIAVRGTLDATLIVPGLLGLAVTMWVAGFDLVYACQDAEFDRREGLHSMPARWGVPASLRLAMGLHLAAWCALATLRWAADLGSWFTAALVVVAALLAYEHRLARRADGRALQGAFFHANAAVGLAVLLGIGGDVLW